MIEQESALRLSFVTPLFGESGKKAHRSRDNCRKVHKGRWPGQRISRVCIKMVPSPTGRIRSNDAYLEL